MKFTQLAKSLEEGLAPVYLLEGEEVYFRENAVKRIRAACGICNPVLNETRFEGEELKGEKFDEFLASLRALPFLDERRLVRACEFHPSEREWEKLRKYTESPSPTTVLLIVNGNKKGGVDLKRKSGIVYVDCSREDEETLSRWVYTLMKREGLLPDADAAGRMVAYCAQDAARMKAETEKLVCLLGKGGRVTRETVETYVAKDAEYKIYELTQAASRRDFTAFSEILSDLNGKGFDESAALLSLTNHFKTLAETAEMRGSDAEVGEALAMKPYAVKKNRELVSRLGAERTKELYLRLYALSSEMKGGIKTKTGALYEGIAKIFFG